MSRIQMPAVDGTFYPADPRVLSEDIDRMLEQSEPAGTVDTPKALVLPHAGYIYSGPVAASGYARLAAGRGRIKRVVAFAPAHRLPFRGLAASSAEYFRTPLGDIPVDAPSVSRAEQFEQVSLLDAAFAGEHALEVHLPFLQRVLDDFTLVPFVVGDADPRDVNEIMEALWGGDETLILVSSDLSHYLDYQSARSNDRKTTLAIEAFEPEHIGYHDACGRTPLNGLLLAARNHNLAVNTVDLRNSGDTAGDKDRVVGYGAYVFS